MQALPIALPLALVSALLLPACGASPNTTDPPESSTVAPPAQRPLDDAGRQQHAPDTQQPPPPLTPPPSDRDTVDSDIDPPIAPEAWPVLLGGTGIDQAHAMALGPDGQIVVAGVMRESWMLGDDLLESPVSGGSAGLVMRFEPDGTPAWGRVLGSSDGHTEINDVAVCPTGRVVVCGGQQKPLLHGDLSTEQGGPGVFLAEWSPDGTPSWLHTFEGKQSDVCGAIAIEQSFDMDTVGHTVAAFEQDGQLQLVRITSDGTLAYHVSHGQGLGLPAAKVSPIQGLATDGQGHVWIAGVLLEGGPSSVGGEEWTLTGESAIFLARYDIHTGEHLWSQSWGSPQFYSNIGFDRVRGLTVMGERVLLSGTSLAGIDFGTGSLGNTAESKQPVGYLVAFDLSGGLNWTWVPTLDTLGVDGSPAAFVPTLDEQLAVLVGDHLIRLDPGDAQVHTVQAITPGAQSLVIDGDGAAVLSYTLTDNQTFGDWELTSAGYTDIVLDRVTAP